MIHNTRLQMVARLMMVIGGIHYLLLALNMNVLQTLSGNWLRAFALVVGISTMYVSMNRDFFLPFLGTTVIGPVFEPTQVQDGVVVQLTGLPAKTKVIYFAAESGTIKNSPREAYGDYKNGGVTMTNENGIANAVIKRPASYKVKTLIGEKTLKSHIHYRYELPGQSGLYSPIKTKYIE